MDCSGLCLLPRALRSERDAEDSTRTARLLSGREREVLGLTAEGYSATDIAERLRISPRTVDTYRTRIMEKLGLHHRGELVRLAQRTGLLAAAH